MRPHSGERGRKPAGTPARVARANGLLEATATYLVAFRGHPDLQSTVVSKAQNYWLKITGASEMHTRGVKVFMINGQGRWRLHAQEPGDMVYKYWQSSLLEKIATSNF